MKTSRSLLSCLFVVACGSGDPKPATPTAIEPTATAPAPTEQVAEPAKLVLGDAKIAMTATQGADSLEVEIVIAADGTVTSTGKSTRKGKQSTKSATLKLTADGELLAGDEVVMKLDDKGAVFVRRSEETRENGKLVTSETKLEEIGTIDEAGVFANKHDGKKFGFDENGNLPKDLVGFPDRGMTITLSTKPEYRRAAMLVLLGTMTSHKSVTDISNSKAEPVTVPPMTK